MSHCAECICKSCITPQCPDPGICLRCYPDGPITDCPSYTSEPETIKVTFHLEVGGAALSTTVEVDADASDKDIQEQCDAWVDGEVDRWYEKE